jgi:protein phosphatase
MNESATYSEPDKADTDELAVQSASADRTDKVDTDELTVPSVPADKPDKADTDELTVPSVPADKPDEDSAHQNEPDAEIVTGLIEITPGERETAIITKVTESAETTVPESEPEMRVAKRCHVGAVRDRNEDSCLVFVSGTGGHFPLIPFGLYIVADGMGGHANGHVASKTASRIAAHSILNDIYSPLLQSSSHQPVIQDVMSNAVHAANAAVFQLDPESDSGTTLTIALVFGRRLYIAHVGDSRIYLFADGQLETVSTDHSLVQRLQEVGQLTAEEATYYQYRHVLLRAVGQTEEVEVDTYMRRLPKSGRLLLCSDGLPTMLNDSTIQGILEQDLPVEETVDQLLTTALDAGGYDNITIVLVEFVL